MPTSDSEGFESADEGHTNFEKKGRKNRNSSSNYSDTAAESDGDHKNTIKIPDATEKVQQNVDETDGWEDFDIDDSQPVAHDDTKPSVSTKPVPDKVQEDKVSSSKAVSKSEDTGWDEFDDWGEADVATNVPKQDDKQPSAETDKDKDIKEVTERLAATSTTPSAGGWGWGWNMDSLLSSATAGLTTITNQVSQGISTVLETGIGAPDPEELAKQSLQNKEDSSEPSALSEKKDDYDEKYEIKPTGDGDGAFPLAPLGSLLKFVGSTGSKVITGGLDTLESIGRRTMDILQENDPLLRRKRQLLGLEADVPTLSAVLREAKNQAEIEDKIKDEKREAKAVHYENLFDDFGGLVHLEALEMLSRQCHFKVQEAIQNAPVDERRDLKETAEQVGELCELPEDEQDDEFKVMKYEKYKCMPKTEALLEKLQDATVDLGVKLTFQPLIKHYAEILEWEQNKELDQGLTKAYKRAISSLAQTTALCVELYHKAAEMLLVRERRMVADEADALTQMTRVLNHLLSEISQRHADIIIRQRGEYISKEIDNVITDVYLKAEESTSYVQNALLLMTPILQSCIVN